MQIENKFGATLNYNPNMPIAEIMRNAVNLKTNGYDGVLVGFNGRYPEITSEFAEKLKAVLTDSGLTTYQLHPLWPDLASPKQLTRENSVNYYRRMIDTAIILDAEILILHPGGSESDMLTNDMTECIKELNIESLEILLNHIAGEKLLIALENMAENVKGQPRKLRFGRSPDELLEILNSMRTEKIGICLDTSHALGSGYQVKDMILKFGKNIIANHLHDTDGNVDKHLPIGEGIINWHEVLMTFKDIGYKQPHLVEVIETDINGIIDSIRFINAIN